MPWVPQLTTPVLLPHQVSRHTFVKALRERGSVMFVPGGQAELVHTHRSFRSERQWVVVTHHKGVT